MMISSGLFNGRIIIDTSDVAVVVFENKNQFRQVVSAFETDTVDESFVFSNDFKPFEFSKKGIYISNPLNVNFESKKLNNKVYSYLENLSEADNQSALKSAKEKLIEFGKDLVLCCDFELDFNPEFDTMSILKLLMFQVNTSELNLADKLVLYLKMISKYLEIKFFVIQNLHLYFSEEEIKNIYETVKYNHIALLIIECIQPEYVLKNEKYLIVDNDLCIIDNCKDQ